MKGETNTTCTCLKHLQNFNPLTREGWDKDAGYATASGYAISIHSPVKGETDIVEKIVYNWWEFQSTHPWRVRQDNKAISFNYIIISIHSPVKGETILT